MSILGKGKAPASTNNVEAYSKETLTDKIRKFNATNIQLIQNKQQTNKTKIALKIDR